MTRFFTNISTRIKFEIARLRAKPDTVIPITPTIKLTPLPDYRRRRFEHMRPERVSKAITAAMCVNDPALAERVDNARRERVAAIKAGRA